MKNSYDIMTLQRKPEKLIESISTKLQDTTIFTCKVVTISRIPQPLDAYICVEVDYLIGHLRIETMFLWRRRGIDSTLLIVKVK